MPFSLLTLQVPDELVGSDLVRNYRTQSSHVGLHSASVPGILCMDIQPIDTNKILTGGNDKNAVVFNKETEQVKRFVTLRHLIVH